MRFENFGLMHIPMKPSPHPAQSHLHVEPKIVNHVEAERRRIVAGYRRVVRMGS